MTRKIFWDDPTITDLITEVTSVIGPCITVAETIFFASTGGQESDTGTIGGYTVQRAVWAGRTILYTLPDDHTLRPGDTVHIYIDRVRRFRLTRLHFAAELVLELTTHLLPDAVKVGAHISAEKARLDFALEGSIAPHLPEITRQTLEMIEANHPIISAFSDVAAERRTWCIEGFAQVPCSGTHPRTTGEIGPVALKRQNPGKGTERIEIRLVEKTD